MISNIENSFNEMNKEYEEVVQEYYEFKSKMTNKNKEKILMKLKTFNSAKTKFSNNLKKLYIKS